MPRECGRSHLIPRRHVYKGTAGEMHLIEAVMGVDQGCRSASYLALGWPLCMNPCASTVAALQDDTYLLSSPEFFKGMLLKRLLLPSPFAGCQTCASPRRWPPVGSAGISIVAQPPLVLKQPLIQPCSRACTASTHSSTTTTQFTTYHQQAPRHL